ncbi:hypothetical protein [Lutibacter sp.]|uniref:hypothetical protein n=1 Tax=Lutibacter sp. TaxID=1925666 RepID=UPI003565FA47
MESKNDLIKGITLSDVYDFVDNGDPNNAPEKMVVYLDLMDKVRGMHHRAFDYGSKESILNHLIKVEKLSRHIATNLYYNSLEYFYASQHLSKQAQNNVYADKIDRLIAVAETAITDVKDAKAVVSMIKDAWLVRGGDKEEKEFIPDEWLKKQFVLYTTDALEAGMPAINRIELKKQIESYPELSEKERQAIMREALIDDIIIFPDEQEDARKD